MEYLEETLLLMRQQDQKSPQYRGISPQINQRRHIIDWTYISATKFGFPRSSIHLAVIIFDRFTDHFSITGEKNSLKWMALASLTIAAKFDCRESEVPKFARLKSSLFGDDETPCKTTAKDFRKIEFTILQELDWNIFTPSPTHYIDLVINEVMRPSDLINGTPLSNEMYNDVVEHFQEFVHYFLDISMQEASLAGEEQAKIAAASIYCARLVLDLQPHWPNHLQNLFGKLPFQQFEHCYRCLFDAYILGDDAKTANNVFSVETVDITPSPPRKKSRRGEDIAHVDEGYVSRTSFVESSGES